MRAAGFTSTRVAIVAFAALVAVIASNRIQIAAQSSQPATQQKLTFDGEVALWTVAIRPDRATDFERILAKLREGLAKSANPQRRQQLAGWTVMKIEKPLPDGNLAYVHIIDPVVPGADYTVMQTLYDEFPNERQELYDLYRAAFAQHLSLAVGSVISHSAPTAP